LLSGLKSVCLKLASLIVDLKLMKKNTFKFEQIFCELVERIQGIETDASSNKFSNEAPLRKFINSEDVTSLQTVIDNDFTTSDSNHLKFTNYKDKDAVELHVVFHGLELALFTFVETLLAVPNTRDEENFADWYPFKSQIVVYVDFDNANYNLQIRICRSDIQIIKRNQAAEIGGSDHQLISALESSFYKIKKKV